MRRQRPLHRLSWSYRALVAVARPTLRVVTRRNWSGAGHLPREGGFIVAANHYSEVDPLTMAHFLVEQGRPPFFLAKASLFEVRGLGAALRSFEQVPVYRASARAGESLAAAQQAIAEGKVVAIMPEGTLTRDPDLWPMRARPGVGRLALSSGAPLVPVAQWGAQRILGRYARRPGNLLRRPVQHVRAGAPVDLSDLADRKDDPAAHAEATRRVMAEITRMLAEMRGQEPPAEPFDPRRGRAS